MEWNRTRSRFDVPALGHGQVTFDGRPTGYAILGSQDVGWVVSDNEHGGIADIHNEIGRSEVPLRPFKAKDDAMKYIAERLGLLAQDSQISR